MEKTVGILGGMGPEATVDFYAKITKLTPARRDQDHLKIVIYSNPQVPDRTQAILHGGESPVPALLEGAKVLQKAGADFIVIPCVSAHFFLEALKPLSPLPIISIFDATIEEIKSRFPQVKRVGLLATTGTIIGGRFQEALAKAGLETLVPGSSGQDLVMEAIYCVKDTHARGARLSLAAKLRDLVGELAGRGAQAIVAGCTELPLILPEKDLPIPTVDPLVALARTAIREAGLEPL